MDAKQTQQNRTHTRREIKHGNLNDGKKTHLLPFAAADCLLFSIFSFARFLSLLLSAGNAPADAMVQPMQTVAKCTLSQH